MKKYCPDYAFCLFECGGLKSCVVDIEEDGQLILDFKECIQLEEVPQDGIEMPM